MGQKIKLDDKEYDVENLSDQAKVTLNLLLFTDKRIQELLDNRALLQRAKKSYIESLKIEVLQSKSGFDFNE